MEPGTNSREAKDQPGPFCLWEDIGTVGCPGGAKGAKRGTSGREAQLAATKTQLRAKSATVAAKKKELSMP